jgi:hypothetical protein
MLLDEASIHSMEVLLRHPLMFRPVALVLSLLLGAGEGVLLAQQPPAAAADAGEPDEIKLSADQLDALVAPIALYPDTLLAQCLVASTYPIDVVQAQQWAEKNKNLKGEELSNAAMKEKWDPSVQALVSLPDALKVLSQDVKWTTDLGNAFLAQQGEVMDAVQRMRGKAKSGGKLATNEQMKVETKVVESKEVVVIESANPEVIYVPSYSPTVVYGPAPYPYPPLYYPPYYAGGAWLGFGVGIAVGIGIAGGWGCGWGGGGNNTININNNNNYVKNNNRQNNISNSGNSNWKHNANQRGGAPYGDRATANKYGGGARGDSAGNRQSAGDRSGGSGASASSFDRGGSGSGSRGGSGGSSSFGGGSGAGADRVGNQSVGGGSGGSGFSGSGSGSRGASASSSRGSSSFSGGGSRSGGGMSRGGGGGRRR